MVYYNSQITGQNNPIYTLNNQVFFIAQLLPRHSDLSKALFTACWSPSNLEIFGDVNQTWKRHTESKINPSKPPHLYTHPNPNHGGNTLRIGVCSRNKTNDICLKVQEQDILRILRPLRTAWILHIEIHHLSI